MRYLIVGCLLASASFGQSVGQSDRGTINRHEYGLLEFADTVDQAFDRVQDGLEMHHIKPDTLLR